MTADGCGRPDPGCDDCRPALETAHRFSWMIYGPEHPEMIVAVCDCGWSDLCVGPLGAGWDAAQSYADHVGYVSPSGEQEGASDGLS